MPTSPRRIVKTARSAPSSSGARRRTASSVVVKQVGIGRLHHSRGPLPIARQTVVRGNRDTLYSAAVFGLDAGPVTIALPQAGERFMTLQIIDQDQYVHAVAHGAGRYTYTREQIGTRYMLAAIRTLHNPEDAQDVKQVHALQDAITVQQAGPGRFEVPSWDEVSRKKVGDALIVLAATIPDTQRMFGSKAEVDPVRHLVGTATGWGGNPPKEAMYLTVVPQKNDGKTIHRLSVKDVPVDGLWSISVYNAQGCFAPNALNAYTLNNKAADGSVAVQFGGCDGKVLTQQSEI
jgi:hypothetical protein